MELLELVHSDVCGKISGTSSPSQTKSQGTPGSAFYKTRTKYSTNFLSGKHLLRGPARRNSKPSELTTDRGIHVNKVRSVPKEGIRHELTVLKTPEQNGMAERLNQTLVEMS